MKQLFESLTKQDRVQYFVSAFSISAGATEECTRDIKFREVSQINGDNLVFQK